MTNFQQQQPRRVDWRHAAVVLFIGCAFCVFAFSEAGGLLANTTLLAASATAIALPLATGLAWLTARKTFPGRPFCDGCFLLLLFLPLFTQLAAWEAA